MAYIRLWESQYEALQRHIEAHRWFHSIRAGSSWAWRTLGLI